MRATGGRAGWAPRATGFSAVVLAGAVCAGCVAAVGDPHGAHSSATGGHQRLAVVDWAVLGGRLSVEVRNAGPSTLGAARVVVTARDRRGTVVAATSGPSPACCVVASLAPGATTSVYAELGTLTTQVRSVQVVPVDVSGAPAGAAAVTGGAVALRTGLSSADVRAAVTSSAAARLLVRAVLVDRAGRLVAAASTEVPCARASTPTPVDLRVGRAVPPGTLVRSVTATPLGACSTG